MYKTFYQLAAEPFRLTPDPNFCFPHKSYEKAKAYMQYALECAEGFVVVTGNPGTGKTTLIHDLISSLDRDNIKACALTSTLQLPDDVLRTVALGFQLDVEGVSKAVLVERLSNFLTAQHQKNLQTLLIVDEAQDFSLLALEELRLLTNFQINNRPLIQIFLIGQEGLRELIQWPVLEQLRQRVVATTHLDPLNLKDTEAYIKHRLHKVGWTKNNPILRPEIFPMIYDFSGGVPRLINLVCNRILLHGSVEKLPKITQFDAEIVINELLEEGLGHQDALASFNEIKKARESEHILSEEDMLSETKLAKPKLSGAFAPKDVADQRTKILKKGPKQIAFSKRLQSNKILRLLRETHLNCKNWLTRAARTIFVEKWPYLITALSIATLLLIVYLFKPQHHFQKQSQFHAPKVSAVQPTSPSSIPANNPSPATTPTNKIDPQSLGLDDPLMKSVLQDVIDDIYEEPLSSQKARR